VVEKASRDNKYGFQIVLSVVFYKQFRQRWLSFWVRFYLILFRVFWLLHWKVFMCSSWATTLFLVWV